MTKNLNTYANLALWDSFIYNICILVGLYPFPCFKYVFSTVFMATTEISPHHQCRVVRARTPCNIGVPFELQHGALSTLIAQFTTLILPYKPPLTPST